MIQLKQERKGSSHQKKEREKFLEKTHNGKGYSLKLKQGELTLICCGYSVTSFLFISVYFVLQHAHIFSSK